MKINRYMGLLVGILLSAGAIDARCGKMSFRVTNKTGQQITMRADLRTSIANFFLPCPDWKEALDIDESIRPSGLMYGCKINDLSINGSSILYKEDEGWFINPSQGVEFIIVKKDDGTFGYKIERCD